MANRYIKSPYDVVGGRRRGDGVGAGGGQGPPAGVADDDPAGQERKPEPRPAFQAPPPRPPRQERPPQHRRDDRDRPAPPRPSRPAGPPPSRQPQDRTAKFQKPRLTVTPPADVPSATAGEPAAPGGPGGPPKKGKPKALPKLSSEALSGKSPLGSFAELEAFFKTKDTPPAPPTEAPPPPAPPTEPPAEGAVPPPA